MREQGPGIEAGQKFEVDAFRPEDAAGVARLFREVYGDAYPMKLVYDPLRLRDACERGDNISLVARTERGDVVGHEAFYRSAPSPRAYELGQGLVLSSYRGLAILGNLQEYAFEVMAPSMDLDVVFGEGVCNHIFMQKALTASRTVPMALEIDLMPVEAYEKEGSAGGRVAALLIFRTYHPRPQTIYMPGRYQDALTFVYEALDDERTLLQSPNEANPPGLPTTITTRVFDFARVARMAVHEGGEDFPGAFEVEERKALARGTMVVQVWLKLSWPWIGAIVEHLKTKGYFFGGALAQWFGGDGLLMQKVFATPSWEGILLHSDRAKKIMEYAREDWANGV
ncbi:MAG TPA: hypothetical protein VGJ94_06015 [Syntrophorhabdaceae bacterium]